MLSVTDVLDKKPALLPGERKIFIESDAIKFHLHPTTHHLKYQFPVIRQWQ